MMTNNIIVYREDDSLFSKLYQWDSDIIIKISGIQTSPLPTIQFANRRCGNTVDVTPTVDEQRLVVQIPNFMLEESNPIAVYISRDEEGETKTIGAFFIPVIARTKPEEENE